MPLCKSRPHLKPAVFVAEQMALSSPVRLILPSRQKMYSGTMAPCTMPRRCSTATARAICMQAQVGSDKLHQSWHALLNQRHDGDTRASVVRIALQAVTRTQHARVQLLTSAILSID